MVQIQDVMSRQIRHLTHLCDGLLEEARLNFGKVELRNEQVDVARIIDDACEQISPYVARCGHTLSVSYPEEPVVVSGDPSRLVQVFANLIQNAAKYTDQNGRLNVDVDVMADLAVVRIDDNGRGIDKNMLFSIFEAFRQEDSENASQNDGLGIGLRLVKTIVDLHGGTVDAHSEGIGRGSEFIVRLPCKPACRLPSERQVKRYLSTADRGNRRRQYIPTTCIYSRSTRFKIVLTQISTALGGSRKAYTMRTVLILSGAALLLSAVCVGADEKQDVSRQTKKPATQPATEKGAENIEGQNHNVTEKAPAASLKKPAAETPVEPAILEERSADEEAIRQTDESFAKAYGRADAKEVAAHFTEDAEFVDELGEVFQGREAIEKSMTAFFAENPDCTLEIEIDSIRFITPDLAIEDGSTIVRLSEKSEPIESRYTTVHAKNDGTWLAASVRDHAPKDRRQHRAQLDQLAWLQGEWIDEGDDAIVTFSCHAADNGNFLVRTFAIVVAGQETMSGTQRIGWDPLTGKLRAWIFDSEGGYAEGLWHRDGENWVLKVTGVTADGQIASSTSIYTYVNDHVMTWQSVDHEIAGVQQPDSEIYTIVRQAPSPLPLVSEDNE